jgi:hypothetical protein
MDTMAPIGTPTSRVPPRQPPGGVSRYGVEAAAAEAAAAEEGRPLPVRSPTSPAKAPKPSLLNRRAMPEARGYGAG